VRTACVGVVDISNARIRAPGSELSRKKQQHGDIESDFFLEYGRAYRKGERDGADPPPDASGVARYHELRGSPEDGTGTRLSCEVRNPASDRLVG